ncbi:MAG: DinB family protein [Acidobacteriota bacterium]
MDSLFESECDYARRADGTGSLLIVTADIADESLAKHSSLELAARRVRSGVPLSSISNMSNLSNTIGSGLIHYYEDFCARVHRLADQLTEEQFWTRPYPFGNSVGNLILHLSGNLNYYIGAQIAGTGYIRDRDLEFRAFRIGQRSLVLKSLDDAIEMVIATLQTQTDDDWNREYSAIGVDDVKNRFSIYLRCAVHFHHHIGQMIYVTKALTDAGLTPTSDPKK